MSDSNLTPSQDIKTRVSQKIQESFLELISPEEFKSLVDKELKAFTQDSRDIYDGEIKKSPLGRMIEEEIRERLLIQLKAELNKPEYQSIFGITGAEPSEFIKKVIEENLVEIVKAQQGAFLQNVLIQLKSQLNSSMPRIY